MRRYPQPDPENWTAVAIAVHCFGCGRRIGVTSVEKGYVYCTELCWLREQLPSLENAARDRFIRLMDERGISQIQVAATFGITRQRVQQILDGNKGDIDYLSAFRRE